MDDDEPPPTQPRIRDTALEHRELSLPVQKRGEVESPNDGIGNPRQRHGTIVTSRTTADPKVSVAAPEKFRAAATMRQSSTGRILTA